MVAVFGVVGLLISGAIPHAGAGRVILLIVALAYFMAGLYLVDRKPVSWYALTEIGRQALQAHLASMQELITRARGGGKN